MKNTDTPVRNPIFELEQIGEDYQIRHRDDNTAVYINRTTALIWNLCNGQRNSGEIKQMLESAYPDVENVASDIDRALDQLLTHGALSTN